MCSLRTRDVGGYEVENELQNRGSSISGRLDWFGGAILRPGDGEPGDPLGASGGIANVVAVADCELESPDEPPLLDWLVISGRWQVTVVD